MHEGSCAAIASKYDPAMGDFGGDEKNKSTLPSLTKNLKAEKVSKTTVGFGFD